MINRWVFRMKAALLLSVLCTSCASAPIVQEDLRMRATIAAVESTISLPKGAARLHEYARYYSEGVGSEYTPTGGLHSQWQQ